MLLGHKIATTTLTSKVWTSDGTASRWRSRGLPLALDEISHVIKSITQSRVALGDLVAGDWHAVTHGWKYTCDPHVGAIRLHFVLGYIVIGSGSFN